MFEHDLTNKTLIKLFTHTIRNSKQAVTTVAPPRQQMAVTRCCTQTLAHTRAEFFTCSTGSSARLHLTVQQAAKTTSGWATIRYHGEENSIHPGGKSRRRGGPATPEVSQSEVLELSEGFLCLFNTEAALTASCTICIPCQRRGATNQNALIITHVADSHFLYTIQLCCLYALQFDVSRHVAYLQC